MRTEATQQSPTANPDTRIIIGADTYASIDIGEETARLVSYKLDEQSLGGQYIIEIDNNDSSLITKQYEGQDVSVYLGFVGSTGSYLHTLTVEKQRFISKAGKLLMQLLCYDTLGKLSLFEGSVGGSIWNHPSQSSAALDQVVLPSGEGLPAALKTAILAQYDKTAWEIITAINTATVGVNITKDSQDDTALSLKPLVVAQDARSGILQALRNTSTYPRLKTNTKDIDFIKPDFYGVAYSFSVGNLFFNDTDERAAVTPNKIVFHGIDVARTLLTTATPHGENAASIALLGQIIEHNDYDPISRENSTTQAVVDAKADARLAKLLLSKGTGTFIAPMHCSLEMYDKVTLVDDRYAPPKTITGYVFRIIREYDRGIYRITVELGGVETGYTPSGGKEAKINPTAPQVTPGNPNINWEYTLPKAIQGYQHDIHFVADDQDTVSWLAGTITFYDGTTQAVAAGNTGNLSDTDVRYIYFDLNDASPNVLKVATVAAYIAGLTESKGVLCLIQKGSAAGIKATVIPSYGKEPLITADVINMAGLLEYDFGSGTKLQAILATQISAGNLKLTSGTVKDGEWYKQTGVVIDASYGVSLYGGHVALRTFATSGAYDTWKALADIDNLTGVQCYVGTDGKIYAGAGTVYLDASGIVIKDVGSTAYFQIYWNGAGPGTLGYIRAKAQTEFAVTAAANKYLVLEGLAIRTVGDFTPYVTGDDDLGDVTHYWGKLYVGQPYNYIGGSDGDLDFYVKNTAGNASVLAMYIADGDDPIIHMAEGALVVATDSYIHLYATTDIDIWPGTDASAYRVWMKRLAVAVDNTLLVIGTVYQNTTDYPIFLTLSVTLTSTQSCYILADPATNPPTTVRARVGNGNVLTDILSMSFIIPCGWYYKITSDATDLLYCQVETIGQDT